MDRGETIVRAWVAYTSLDIRPVGSYSFVKLPATLKDQAKLSARQGLLLWGAIPQ
jgi:hypothetical protein